MPRILIAASPEITNSAWIERCLLSALPRNGLEVLHFGDNSALSEVLGRLGCDVSQNIKGASTERRSEIRRSLSLTDHLLLLWDGRSMTKLLFEARLKAHPTKLFTIEVTSVANKDRGDDFDVYIGRGTPWGNPYPVGKQEGQYERSESIDLFRRHFEANLLPDPSIRKGLLGLRGLRLACHCKPLACHGDVIAGYLNSLDPDECSTTFQSGAENPEPLAQRSGAA